MLFLTAIRVLFTEDIFWNCDNVMIFATNFIG